MSVSPEAEQPSRERGPAAEAGKALWGTATRKRERDRERDGKRMEIITANSASFAGSGRNDDVISEHKGRKRASRGEDQKNNERLGVLSVFWGSCRSAAPGVKECGQTESYPLLVPDPSRFFICWERWRAFARQNREGRRVSAIIRDEEGRRLERWIFCALLAT